MKKHHNIVIAGAGGIAEAVALILAEWSGVTPTLFVGDRLLAKAKQVAELVKESATKPCLIEPYELSEKGLTDEMEAVFKKGDILLDCLPGSQAPRMAGFAKDFKMHYANLTEYVAETQEIMALAKDAKTGFALQSGLAPGYADILANGLFQEFCSKYDVTKAERLEVKVGALTHHAVAPHYYGFTWSPVGVATEYMKDAIVIRDFKKTTVPALSQRATIFINGIQYEEDLTSGGAADLPDALAGRIRFLEYKTLRHPGHYDWVQEQISVLKKPADAISGLQKKMEAAIPHVEDDQIVLYVAVEGKDSHGILRRMEIAKQVFPQKVGNHKLRAIQITTASALVQTAQILLESPKKGIILQSDIDPLAFLNGNYIIPVYRKILI